MGASSSSREGWLARMIAHWSIRKWTSSALRLTMVPGFLSRTPSNLLIRRSTSCDICMLAWKPRCSLVGFLHEAAGFLKGCRGWLRHGYGYGYGYEVCQATRARPRRLLRRLHVRYITRSIVGRKTLSRIESAQCTSRGGCYSILTPSGQKGGARAGRQATSQQSQRFVSWTCVVRHPRPSIRVDIHIHTRRAHGQ